MEPLITEHDVADWLGMSVQALRRWRTERRGPAYVKMGKAVRYERAAVQTYIEASRREGVQGDEVPGTQRSGS